MIAEPLSPEIIALVVAESAQAQVEPRRGIRVIKLFEAISKVREEDYLSAVNILKDFSTSELKDTRSALERFASPKNTADPSARILGNILLVLCNVQLISQAERDLVDHCNIDEKICSLGTVLSRLTQGEDRIKIADNFQQLCQLDKSCQYASYLIQARLREDKKVEYFQKAYDLINSGIASRELAYALGFDEKSDFVQVDKYFTEALKAFPRSTQVKFLYAQVLIYRNSITEEVEKIKSNQDEIINLLRDSFNLNKKDLNIFYKLINCLCERGQKSDFAECKELFSEAVKFNSNIKELLEVNAEFLLHNSSQSKDWDYAIELLQSSFKIGKNSSRKLVNCANLLVERNLIDDYSEAEKLFRVALEINSTDIVTLNSYARMLGYQGRYEESETYFLRSISVNPNNPITINSYAAMLGSKEISPEFERSFALFEKSLEINPDQVVGLKSYAKILIRRGSFLDLKKARDIYKKIITLPKGQSPQTFLAYARFLAIKHQSVDRDLAFALCDKALENSPGNPEILKKYANIAFKFNATDKAEELFKKALSIRRNDSYALNSYAKMLGYLGRNSEAVVLFEEALNYFPDNSIILSSYGRNYFERALSEGDQDLRFDYYTQAENLLKSAIERDPRNIDAKKFMGQMLSSRGLSGDYINAKYYFSEALGVRPHEIGVLYSYGIILLKHKEYTEANRKFLTISGIDPMNPYGAQGLGFIALANNDIEAAHTYFRMGLNSGVILEHSARTLVLSSTSIEQLQKFSTEIESAYNEFPKSDALKYGMAQLRSAAGQFQEALDYLNKVDVIPVDYRDFAKLIFKTMKELQMSQSQAQIWQKRYHLIIPHIDEIRIQVFSQTDGQVSVWHRDVSGLISDFLKGLLS